MHIIIFPCHPSPSTPFHTSKWHRASHQGKLFRKLSSFSIEACGGGDNGRVARTSDILMQRHLCRSESGDFGVCQTPPHLFPLSPTKPEPDMHPFFKEDDTGRQGLYLNFWFFIFPFRREFVYVSANYVVSFRCTWWGHFLQGVSQCLWNEGG